MVNPKAGEVQRLIEPVVTAMGYELVGVEYLSRGRQPLVRLFIDTDEGITLDDCEKVSRQVSGVLDVEDPIRGEYTLEVSSPGLDRPLFTGAHFERFTGYRARIRLGIPQAGRRNFSGVIAGVRDGMVIMVDGDVEHALPLSGIDKANLVPDEL